MIITSNAVLMMRQVKLSEFKDEESQDEDVLVECNRSSSHSARGGFSVGTAGSASLVKML